MFESVAAEDTTGMELMFSPDRDELVRMRARDPGEEEASEAPVEENTYYRQPRRLTEESQSRHRGFRRDPGARRALRG